MTALPYPSETGPALQPWEETSQRQTRLRAAATLAEAARPVPSGPGRWLVRLVRDMVSKADRDRVLALAAETAFWAVLTLFPGLLAAVAVLGQLGSILGSDGAREVEEAVVTFFDQALTSSASGVTETVRGVFDSAGSTLTLATLLALVSVSTAFATTVNTLTIACDVSETRGWWQRRALGLVLGTGTVIVGAAAVSLLVVGPLFGRGLDVVSRFGLSGEYAVLWDYARYPAAFLALVLWTATLYHFAPATRTRWRSDVPGAVLAAVLWLLATTGLNLYLQLVVTRSPVLGALGGGLILMTWVYLLSAGLLVGAELNTILHARRKVRADRRDQTDERVVGDEDVPRGDDGDGPAPGTAPQQLPTPSGAHRLS